MQVHESLWGASVLLRIDELPAELLPEADVLRRKKPGAELDQLNTRLIKQVKLFLDGENNPCPHARTLNFLTNKFVSKY